MTRPGRQLPPWWPGNSGLEDREQGHGGPKAPTAPDHRCAHRKTRRKGGFCGASNALLQSGFHPAPVPFPHGWRESRRSERRSSRGRDVGSTGTRGRPMLRLTRGATERPQDRYLRSPHAHETPQRTPAPSREHLGLPWWRHRWPVCGCSSRQCCCNSEKHVGDTQFRNFHRNNWRHIYSNNNRRSDIYSNKIHNKKTADRSAQL